MPVVVTYDEASKIQNDCRPRKRFSHLLQSFASTRRRGKQPRKSEKNFMLGLFTTITCLTSQNLSFAWVSFLPIHSHKIYLKRGIACKPRIRFIDCNLRKNKILYKHAYLMASVLLHRLGIWGPKDETLWDDVVNPYVQTKHWGSPPCKL